MTLALVIGVSAFGVLMTDNFPSFETSHAQPLPKRFTAASVNASLHAPKEPKAAFMALRSPVEGVVFLPSGERVSQ